MAKLFLKIKNYQGNFSFEDIKWNQIINITTLKEIKKKEELKDFEDSKLATLIFNQNSEQDNFNI